ncbi:hypothetical protein [Thioclava sp. GXIMD4216]|uniref:Peptidase inhibitor I78 family protein n=1 Tax=Thioclava litoralis TaxID=3076557 RepID=A0ABZ1E1A3_9RHOB|nr:hypothetical protein RPE78_04265 [Thioclava sp. FTW29]
MLTRVYAFAAIGLLAACQPSQQELAPTPILPESAQALIQPENSADGLNEREPDLCGAKAYSYVLGQPGSVVSTLPLGDTKYRVVEWRGVEDQLYQPHRIVFRLDEAGNVYNVDCG